MLARSLARRAPTQAVALRAAAATQSTSMTRRTMATIPDANMGRNPEEVEQGRQTIKRDTRRNPELYVLGTIMTGAFALAGYFFAGRPTSANSERPVAIAMNSRPWESGTSGKYQYHPDGDRTAAPRDAPSALHSTIIPNVNLPKELHDQWNKYDKDEYDDY